MLTSVEQALGLDDHHLVDVPGCGQAVRRLHSQVVDDFIHLRERCADEGIQLGIASSYRSFQQQLSIWNAKMRGERAVYDEHGKIIDVTPLSDDEKLPLLLRWTALPGCSRHHWGTDLDVYDMTATTDGYALQLLPEEYIEGGPFAHLGKVLSAWCDTQVTTRFYRPYAKDNGGVAVEPWHLSHRAVAHEIRMMMTPSCVADVLAKTEIEGKEAILANFDAIWQRYVA